MAVSTHIHVEQIPVQIKAGPATLQGDLTIPDEPLGVVLFAHGSGSSRFSRRNRAVASELNEGHLATLLIDLLTAEEEQVDEYTAHLRFDIGMLADRLVEAIDWLSARERTQGLPIGLFGASIGGGAALVAASSRPDRVSAVVSRGGRPDLAGDALREVTAPTLLIVGGADFPVIDMNRDAMEQMHGPVKLEIVPGATHLFEEPGTLEQVAALAREWFREHLTAHAP